MVDRGQAKADFLENAPTEVLFNRTPEQIEETANVLSFAASRGRPIETEDERVEILFQDFAAEIGTISRRRMGSSVDSMLRANAPSFDGDTALLAARVSVLSELRQLDEALPLPPLQPGGQSPAE